MTPEQLKSAAESIIHAYDPIGTHDPLHLAILAVVRDYLALREQLTAERAARERLVAEGEKEANWLAKQYGDYSMLRFIEQLAALDKQAEPPGKEPTNADTEG